jgi:hypothetical protein
VYKPLGGDLSEDEHALLDQLNGIGRGFVPGVEQVTSWTGILRNAIESFFSAFTRQNLATPKE